MEGMTQLIKTVRLIQRELNPRLAITAQVFETVIPRNVRLSEAPSHGLPALLYDISSRGAMAYLDLAREIIRMEKQ